MVTKMMMMIRLRRMMMPRMRMRMMMTRMATVTIMITWNDEHKKPKIVILFLERSLKRKKERKNGYTKNKLSHHPA